LNRASPHLQLEITMHGGILPLQDPIGTWIELAGDRVLNRVAYEFILVSWRQG
jgi:hypothetical protein